MTVLTVDDLARDLKVRNEDLLRELVTMGYEVDSPESPLETDDPAALRAQLVTVLPQREMVEKRIRPTVIRRRVKPSPHPEQREGEPFAGEEFVAATDDIPEDESLFVSDERTEAGPRETLKKPIKKMKKPEPARIIEMAPKPEAVRPVDQREPELAPPRREVIPAQPAILSADQTAETKAEVFPHEELRSAEPARVSSAKVESGVKTEQAEAARIIHSPEQEARVGTRN